jgi:outer membrane immunogenic protein
MWTGFYIGLNAGGTWGGNTQVAINGSYAGTQNPSIGANYTGVMSALGATRSIGAGIGGFIGGGQIGYNYQLVQRFVVGFEADIQGIAGASANGQSSSIVPLQGSHPPAYYQPGELFGTVVKASKNINYLGTVRGRIGFLPTQNLLVYLTGGLSYGGVSSQSSILQVNNDLQFSGGNQSYALYSPTWGKASYSNSLTGWTAGGGAEWMFSQNWSAKGEYLYYDLGAVGYSMTPLTTTSGSNPGIWSLVIPKASTRFNGNIIRAGVNYHFNFANVAPVAAKFESINTRLK